MARLVDQQAGQLAWRDCKDLNRPYTEQWRLGTMGIFSAGIFSAGIFSASTFSASTFSVVSSAAFGLGDSQAR